MDLVVRSPHGAADVTVLADDVAATLGDVVAEVTGQAVPGIVVVDDRVLPASTPLTDANVRVGSVLSTVTTETTRTSMTTRGTDGQLGGVSGGFELVQHAGRGAGTIRTIEPGQYRVGPGRRLAAPELADAPVETAAFELVASADGASVRPGDPAAVMLAGRAITDREPWTEGDLVVGSRVFGLEPRSPSIERRASDPDGTVPFTRTAVLTTTDEPRSVVDAVRRALHQHPSLWRRRLDEHATLTLPVGLVDEGGPHLRRVSVLLGPDRGAAIVGTAEFGEGVARTLLIEAVTTYGPADLRVVVATSSDRAGRWDWLKWMPHARVGGELTILTSEGAQRRWADALWSTPPGRRPLTVLIIDDPEHWNRRDSPMREVVSSPPTSVRLVVECDRVESVPASCRSLVVQDDLVATVTSATTMSGVKGVTSVIPSLVDDVVATDVARALAPLVDIDAGAFDDAHAVAAPAVPRLIDALRAMVVKDSPSRRIWLGVAPDHERVELDWRVTSEVALTSGEPGDLDALVIVLVAGLIAGHDAGTVPLLIVDDGQPSPALDALLDLPHVAGRCSLVDPLERRRVVARLAAHASTPGVGAGVVVLGDAADSGLDDWVVDLQHLAARSPSLRLIVARHGEGAGAVDRIRPRRGMVDIDVDRRSGVPVATITTSALDGGRRPFAPLLLPTSQPTGPIVVRPFVVGRPLSSLERRLSRTSGVRPHIDTEAAAFMRSTLVSVRRPPRLVPPVVPERIDIDDLFSANEADAIPIGVRDDVVHGELPVVWWQPGPAGSALFVGSPRSGLDDVIATIARGVAERFSPNDLRLVAIDSSSRRLAAIASMPHTAVAVAADRTDQVASALEHLATEVELRRLEPDVDRPKLVLLVHDLGQVTRRLIDRDHRGALDALHALAAAAPHGVNFVAVATTITGTSELLETVAEVYVGSLTNTDDRALLGYDEAEMAACSSGRCWSRSTGQLVQLATSTRPLDRWGPVPS